jgi:hypothetical protein
MMDKVCTFCGADDRLQELNHPFGRALEPGVMYYVCRSGCHYIFTGWQWADRVPLDKTRDEPPADVKQRYMILAISRCLELTGYSADSVETTAVIQSLARGFISTYSTGQRVKSWDDGSMPRGKTLNPANVPHPKLRPENVRFIHAAMAGIEAYLYEQAHGLTHPSAILLRHFEADPELTREVFEKFDGEITALQSKGLLTQPKIQRALVTRMSTAIGQGSGS